MTDNLMPKYFIMLCQKCVQNDSFILLIIQEILEPQLPTGASEHACLKIYYLDLANLITSEPEQIFV